MTLAGAVSVSKRFQRSIRIDTDLKDDDTLEGFVCPKSSAVVLETMAQHLNESRQGAFTWTGPYGSGKSSLVVALSALVDGRASRRKKAQEAVGDQAAQAVFKAFPAGKQGWKSVPVIGQRSSVASVMGPALIKAGLVARVPKGGWTDRKIIAALINAAQGMPGNTGVIVFVDEMGKFLEGAARENEDLYVFQELAEAAARSNGKLVVVGILHQAFADYANRLSREARDEWTKIQGRFVDLAVNAAGEEQIELLARAIESNRANCDPSKPAKVVADSLRRSKPGVSQHLAKSLERTWPLHPSVSVLLGPIARCRFGQNQRSLFGFLNSAEPGGFQHFLHAAREGETFTPDLLWDYLRLNFESSILASSDGHRWAIASEALDRCEAGGATELQVKALKTIAVLDLFRERSGLAPTKAVLIQALPCSLSELEQSLDFLKTRSLIIYRRHLSAFSVYAGSDFDIEKAVEAARVEAGEGVDWLALQRIAALQPVLAKRHYFETGSMRWMTTNLSPVSKLFDFSRLHLDPGAIGAFVLAFPDSDETKDDLEKYCRQVSKKASASEVNVIVGSPTKSWAIMELAKEVRALEFVRDYQPELKGDSVARREVDSRLATLQNQLEADLSQCLMAANWFFSGRSIGLKGSRELNALASEIADATFCEAPRIHNELLNRTKPSSNGVAAQNALLKLMVNSEGLERLGIEGYPAEGGLFESVLHHTKLYAYSTAYQQFRFRTPRRDIDSARIGPAFRRASDILKKQSDRSVSMGEVFRLWEQAPHGIKKGLMPVLGVAFLLAYKDELAFYREGIFQSRFSDLDAELLAKNASDIQVRWMPSSNKATGWLSGVATLVANLDPVSMRGRQEPIQVAQSLVALYDNLPTWAKRTRSLSAKALRVRDILKSASDPNKLLLNDLPAACDPRASLDEQVSRRRILTLLREILSEITEAYPRMLEILQETLLSELRATDSSLDSLQSLRARAINIQQISGDFRLDSFVNRMIEFDGARDAIEGIGSLAANKPPRDWVDADLKRAQLQIAEFCQGFRRVEGYAHVHGRKDNRHAYAVIVGRAGQLDTRVSEFEVSEEDRPAIDKLVKRARKLLSNKKGNSRSVVLAALAELSGELMDVDKDSSEAAETNFATKGVAHDSA